MWKAWDKWVLVENLLTVQSLKQYDKIRWKGEKVTSSLKSSPLEWDHNSSWFEVWNNMIRLDEKEKK